MQYDLKNLTFIYHVRVDTNERAENIKISANFLRRNCTNYKTIYVEDGDRQQLPGLINFTENDTYLFKYNEKMWNRCDAFNEGIRLSRSNYLAFCDVDIIIHPNQFIESVEYLEENPNTGIIYPYCGMFLCVTEEVKNEFSNTLDYNTLDKIYPERDFINFNNGYCFVGHNNSVGGCVMGRRDNLIKAKGYNPNFIGWGYEDNEFPKRVHAYGFDVCRKKGGKRPLWHLPHDGVGQSPKADNPYIDNNKQISDFVCNTATKEQIIEYAEKSWTLL